MSMMIWPDYKTESEEIIAELEKGAASIELSEEQQKDFNKYMGLLRWNDKALHEWGDDRGKLHFIVYLIYLLSTIVLLRIVRKKNNIIKELENSSI